MYSTCCCCVSLRELSFVPHMCDHFSFWIYRFTPGCSKSHLPSFMTAQEELKAKGVELTICVATNDAYVMEVRWRRWGEKVIDISCSQSDPFCVALYCSCVLCDRPGGVRREAPTQAFVSCRMTRESWPKHSVWNCLPLSCCAWNVFHWLRTMARLRITLALPNNLLILGHLPSCHPFRDEHSLSKQHSNSH